jgi:hypothetical protein
MDSVELRRSVHSEVWCVIHKDVQFIHRLGRWLPLVVADIRRVKRSYKIG